MDGLRAVAVLSVVAYHAGLPVPAGFVGVDVFFVISGYLITRLLHDEVQSTGRIDFMAFYARRARRILPALVAVVLATLGLCSLFGNSGEVAKSAVAASAFVANVFFQHQTGGYWSADSQVMPLLHLWSLSVEEQFYLVWPVVLILARRKPVAALASIAVASLALWLWLDPQAAFYQMPARAWELALGGLVALRPVNVPRGSAWAGLSLILLACFVPFGHFPGVAVIGSALVIAAVQNGERLPVLEARPVVFVGLVSYSFYLWHWPLLAIDHANRIGDAPLAVRLGLVALGFLLAVASYRYIETPFRKARGSHRRAVSVGVACLLALSAGAWALEPPARSGEPPAAPICGGTLQPASCVHGPSVAIWGDSMAESWHPLAEGLAAKQHMAGVDFAQAGCPPYVGEVIKGLGTKYARFCPENNAAAIAYAHTRQVDTLIIAAHWQQYAKDGGKILAAVDAVAPYVRRVVVIGPTPQVKDNAIKCATLHVTCAISRNAYLADAGLSWKLMLRMKRHPNVEVIDASRWLCEGDECSALRNGRPMYRDAYHVNDRTAREFADYWLNQ